MRDVHTSNQDLRPDLEGRARPCSTSRDPRDPSDRRAHAGAEQRVRVVLHVLEQRGEALVECVSAETNARAFDPVLALADRRESRLTTLNRIAGPASYRSSCALLISS